MATKMQSITDLALNTTEQLCKYENWTSFLRSAAWQYKYSFQDQVYIYAQRPDAKACATLEMWNKNLHRWINKGAKGIALLRRNNGKNYLETVWGR